MFVAWSSGLITGHTGIDNQHKVLFSLFNRLAEVMRQGNGQEEVGRALSSLSIYVVVHFKMEDGLMAGVNFPGFDKHVQGHAAMKQQIEKLIEKHNRHELDPNELFELLRYWIEHHVKTEDRLLAEFVRRNGVIENAV